MNLFNCPLHSWCFENSIPTIPSNITSKRQESQFESIESVMCGGAWPPQQTSQVFAICKKIFSGKFRNWASCDLCKITWGGQLRCGPRPLDLPSSCGGGRVRLDLPVKFTVLLKFTVPQKFIIPQKYFTCWVLPRFPFMFGSNAFLKSSWLGQSESRKF